MPRRSLRFLVPGCALYAFLLMLSQAGSLTALGPLFSPPPLPNEIQLPPAAANGPAFPQPSLSDASNSQKSSGPTLSRIGKPNTPLRIARALPPRIAPLKIEEGSTASLDDNESVSDDQSPTPDGSIIDQPSPDNDLPPPPIETLPPVSTQPAPPVENGSPPVAPPADANPNVKDPAEKKDKLGEEPPATSIDIFRQSTVLLPEGVVECTCGMQYTLFEDNFLTILPSSVIAPQRTSNRTGLGLVSLRYGYSADFQPFITVPGGASSVEIANTLNDFHSTEYGIGDVTFGGSYLLVDGGGQCADVVFNLSCVAPTGESNFLSLVPGNASLGNGFWIVSPSFSWTKTFDPVVLFASAAYLHRFEREHFGAPIRPGEEFDIGYGAGFAINDEITYSLQFQWAHQFDTYINGVAIEDTGADIATIRQAAIIRLCPQKFIEVFFANGVTTNSPEVSMGISIVRRY